MENRYHLDLLDKEQVDAIYQSALRVLEKTGVAFHHDRALGVLTDGGALIDKESKVAKFPPDMVKKALKKVRRSFSLYGRDGKKRIDFQPGQTHFLMATYDKWILDYRTGERRLPTLGDVRCFIIVDDALEPVEAVGQQIVPRDVPLPLTQIKTAEMVLKNTPKPALLHMMDLRDAKYVFAMAEAAAGGRETFRKKPIFMATNCPAAPLRYGKLELDVMFENSIRSLPQGIGPCPTAGMSGPVTLAGMLVQIMAEALAGIVFVKILNEEQPVWVGPSSFFMNQDGSLSFGSPERILVEWGTAQVCQSLGIPAGGSGPTTDAKAPTMQAGIEKTLGLTMMTLSGSDFINVCPILDEGSTTALEQHIIDADIIGLVKRLVAGVKVSPETLAVDVINEVLTYRKKYPAFFLSHRHTVKHYREEMWFPDILFRGSWENFEKQERRGAIENAQARMEEILKTHEPEPLAKEVQQDIDNIVKRAEKELQ